MLTLKEPRDVDFACEKFQFLRLLKQFTMESDHKFLIGNGTSKDSGRSRTTLTTKVSKGINYVTIAQKPHKELLHPTKYKDSRYCQ